MNLCKPCIGPSLWSLAPHAPSFSTLTPAEDASFPLLRFMFSFQLLNLCGVAAGSYFANHQFRKQGHLGGFHGQPIIYAFEGHLRSSMYLNVRSKVKSSRVGRESLKACRICICKKYVYYGVTAVHKSGATW